MLVLKIQITSKDTDEQSQQRADILCWTHHEYKQIKIHGAREMEGQAF